ncbi:bidirectional sugar transporter SWEET15-like [Cucurbita pepo subsp. pepo]|uniref:bidirectional sugar transporter SWEET15-like n=1 Tax=Cucurbita pepo subsp. pepo TaxID=3664 RepID=UPI000C9D660F|nr:bidirectional sugar transporter SWEET15-like [Cucurbita pepo subsp. pepo]
MAIFHSPHILALTFGILGNILSIFVYLAPLPTFYRICQKKSTEGFHALPYLVALFSSALWLYYAILKTNTFLLITINSFGCVLEFLYLIVFIAFAANPVRMLTIRIFAVINLGLLGFILLAIHFIPKRSNAVKVMGWICVAVSISVFAAPLSVLRQVIKTKSVEFLPFSLSFFLTLSAVMWFAYGVFLKDMCIAIPNVVGFILGLLQMLLYAVYRKRKIMEEKLPEQVKSIAVVAVSEAQQK